jgi:cell division protein FtsB
MRKPHLVRGLANLFIEKRHRLIISGGVACFLLLSLLAMAGERGFLEVYQFSRHLKRVESRIRVLEGENERLWRQVTGLRSDPYQVEKLAREDLGLVRPDEIIFEIVDGEPPNSPWGRVQQRGQRE